MGASTVLRPVFRRSPDVTRIPAALPAGAIRLAGPASSRASRGRGLRPRQRPSSGRGRRRFHARPRHRRKRPPIVGHGVPSPHRRWGRHHGSLGSMPSERRFGDRCTGSAWVRSRTVRSGRAAYVAFRRPHRQLDLWPVHFAHPVLEYALSDFHVRIALSWPAQPALVETGYRNLQAPFARMNVRRSETTVPWPLWRVLVARAVGKPARGWKVPTAPMPCSGLPIS